MSRRRLLLVLGLVLPLAALLVAMRVAASWRPVALGKLVSGGENVSDINAEPGRVLFGGQNGKGQRIYGWFDLGSGGVHKVQTAVPRRTGTSNGYNWMFQIGDKAQTLEVTNDAGFKRVYVGHDLFPPRNSDLPVRILPDQNRVVLMGGDRIAEWNFTTARLLKTSLIRESVPETLSRDARTFIQNGDGYNSFQICDTGSSKILRTIRWRTPGPIEYNYFSPYGRYSIFDSNGGTFHVVEVATGKLLWKFPTTAFWKTEFLMPDDEKTIWVVSGKEWQVRDFGTGAVLRRFVYVPDQDTAALSEDGATLYCVADGTLYRQRVR